MTGLESDVGQGIPCLRPMHAQMGLISRSDGSAQFSQGRTTVLAGVFGPAEVKQQKELVDRATVDVSYRPKVGPSSVEDRAREALVKGTLEAALMLTLHPRTSVLLSIQQLEDDGGELACCLNAACLALVDAALAMKGLFAAVTVALAANDIWLDPTSKQKAKATAVVTFVFDSTNKDIVATHMEGKCSEKKFQQCLAAAKEASEAVFQFYRESIQRRFSKELQ